MQLLRVLEHSPVAHLVVTELTFHDPGGMLGLGSEAGLQLLKIVQQIAQRLAVCPRCRVCPEAWPALASTLALAGTLIASVGEDIGLFTVQKAVGFDHVVDVRRPASGVSTRRVMSIRKAPV
jgi:hypothetical protein